MVYVVVTMERLLRAGDSRWTGCLPTIRITYDVYVNVNATAHSLPGLAP